MRRILDPITFVLPQPYALLVLRWWWLAVLCVTAAGSAALAVSMATPPTYEATSQLLINQARSPTGDSYSDLLLSERLASTYARLMTRATTLDEALVRLGLDPESRDGLISDVRVAPIRDTQLVELTVEGSSPEVIAAVANVLPSVFEEELRAVQSKRYSDSKRSLSGQLDALSRQVEQTQLAIAALGDSRTAQEELEHARLTSLLAQYEASYSDVLRNYEEVRLAEAQSVDSIATMQPAVAPDSPTRPRTMVNVLLATIMGAMVAVGTVFLVEYLDDRVRTPDDVARIADLPVVGSLVSAGSDSLEEYDPKVLISVRQPRHAMVEDYRRLRTNLECCNIDRQIGSLAMTSAGAREGKSLITANLAVIMAQSGVDVVVVDTDLRRPQQHRLFGLTRRPGLGDALLAGDVTRYVREPAVDVQNLRVLTAGEPAPFPAEALGSERMRDIIRQLGTTAGLLIFDTPPVLAVTDAQIIGQLVDGTVLVIDAQKTAGAAVRQALELLSLANAPVVGVVLNRLPERASSYYYDAYGYDEYAGETTGERKKRKRRGTVQTAQQPFDVPFS